MEGRKSNVLARAVTVRDKMIPQIEKMRAAKQPLTNEVGRVIGSVLERPEYTRFLPDLVKSQLSTTGAQLKVYGNGTGDSCSLSFSEDGKIGIVYYPEQKKVYSHGTNRYDTYHGIVIDTNSDPVIIPVIVRCEEGLSEADSFIPLQPDQHPSEEVLRKMSRIFSTGYVMPPGSASSTVKSILCLRSN